MTKFFQVAGHVFGMNLPEGLFKYLDQYDPFTVPEPASDQLLFSLSWVEKLPEVQAEKVYDPPTEDGQTVVVLSHFDGGWLFEMAPDRNVPIKAWLMTDEDFTHGRLALGNRRIGDGIFGVNNAAMLMFAFCAAPLGTLELHASMVSNAGKAFLFMAKSGTGKSTHSQLWLDYVPGSELMNDDNPVVRVWPDGRVMAYGSPWSGKTPCYRNVEAPVGAFVRIRRSPVNRITRLGLLESYALLYSSCSGFKADSCMADGLHASLERSVLDVPCYVLDCRPDEEAAQVCSREVLK